MGAAVVGESVLLAVAGSVIGAGVIYRVLNDLPANTNFLGNTQFAFQFVVPARLLLEAVLGALARRAHARESGPERAVAVATRGWGILKPASQRNWSCV